MVYDVRARLIACEYACRQAELRIVRARYRFFFIVEFQHGHHRPENLLASDAHLVLHVGKDRRLDEESALEALQRRHAAAAVKRAVRGGQKRSLLPGKALMLNSKSMSRPDSRSWTRMADSQQWRLRRNS